jgi:hypothetical protein
MNPSLLLQSMHNIPVPPMPADQRQLVWVGMGQSVAVTPTITLSTFADRQVGSDVSTLRLVLRYPGGNTMTTVTPEGLAYLSTDVVVRCVESNARGPVRVLVEIGDMVAFPSLRAVA